ncbi:serine/threonine-protein kinase [Micromonospora inyonensis]|uniref:non-specific serine/threonine protein kinase n=1 Tax=Micromonospora inyonensis TaxID=47866 RepID=A0A1C6SFY5_9ACTN|nr:serine/threonine-protein kinase [Micromonospora inyonensis]SCL28376.1 Serine/threonine protein kinase [Micromonospora inyonensis]
MTGLTGAPVPGVAPLWTHDPVTAGPYRLLGRLGAGGQGVVYLGEDDQGHQVAIKMINADLSDLRVRSQFMKEVAAARRVAPFCTAQVLFAEVDGEQPYVVSEFIQGPTLYRHVREHGPVAGNALHRLAIGTATALAAIHRSDVVHCDLKPDNVVLGPDGPRVIDFGIARALGVTETVTSRVMGTTAYMAPERFRNDPVGPPCDVFAWAGTIAYAAGGRPPFGNDSLFAVMHRVLNDPPDLPPLPPELDELIRQCLAKEPGDRPAAEQVLMRLLGQDARVTAPLRPETVLQVGNETAGAPTPNEPLPLPRPAPHTPVAPTRPTVATRPEPTVPPQARPSSLDRPAAPLPDRHAPVDGGWGRRLRREAGDAWGISTAIFLAAVGGATGYVASSTVAAALAAGTATFVVVYLVRMLVAVALGGRSDRP